MDSRSEQRTMSPRAVDLRRARAPEIEIVDCVTYDFVLSLHVTLVASHTDVHEFDIGADWVANARARCEQADPHACDTLGLYLGDGRPASLQATVISLVGQCPAPNDPLHFLDFLRTLPAADLAEALLDQDGMSAEWPSLLRAALNESPTEADAVGSATQRLLANYPGEARPIAQRVLSDVEGARAELIAALRVWYDAVFAAEEAQLAPVLRREAEQMARRRAEQPLDVFVESEMRGVEWQRPRGLRRYIFAPSVFCQPAVFYHLWRGTLTFCTPIISAAPSVERNADPSAPDDELLRFFETLGDETRLRILRLLAQREMYLTELAERLGLTKATVKHHMVRLRAAGLVTLHDRPERERKTHYSLRRDIASRAQKLLDAFFYVDADTRL
ncbi:MAG TPA: winged helix-turn-helix domain-containing protein [Ktedonobacterales bacterium]|nr:winged helix-turn-helix domain-containing protein [Ktedonobacterales bacterium]